jgi:hypothetical protein
MRRLKTVSLGTLSLYAFLSLGALTGCGDSSTTNAPLSEEAKKVDQKVQDGMKAYMQEKSKGKPKSK